MEDITIRRVADLNDPVLPSLGHHVSTIFRGEAMDTAFVGGDLSLSNIMYEAVIKGGVVDGEVWVATAKPHVGEKEEVNEEILGMIQWFGPGTAFLATAEQRAAGWDAFVNDSRLSEEAKKWQREQYGPANNALRARAFPNLKSQTDAYHVILLGVVPGMQGRGIGGRLLRLCLDKATKEKEMVFLMTNKQSNITIYEHWGFGVRTSEKLSSPWGDFVATAMSWEPEPGGEGTEGHS